MTREELKERRDNLLGDDKLKINVAKMIRTKDLPAALRYITTIAGRDGRDEIVIELLIDVIDTGKIAKVFLYITEDLFDKYGFEFVDEAIGKRIDNVSIDDRILLRALRVVFTVIKNVSGGYAFDVDPNMWIYVRTSKIGLCDYRN